MAVIKLKVKHTNNLGTKTNSEIFSCSSVLDAGNITSDTAVAIDTWAHGFVALSTDTYDDSEITTTQSINEILAE